RVLDVVRCPNAIHLFLYLSVFLRLLRPHTSTLFPYTTLFRSFPRYTQGGGSQGGAQADRAGSGAERLEQTQGCAGAFIELPHPATEDQDLPAGPPPGNSAKVLIFRYKTSLSC